MRAIGQSPFVQFSIGSEESFDVLRVNLVDILFYFRGKLAERSLEEYRDLVDVDFLV